MHSQSCSTWANHQDIKQLSALNNVLSPPTPTDNTLVQNWIKELAIISHATKIETHKTTTKQIVNNHKHVTTKYHTILNLKPKSIHKNMKPLYKYTPRLSQKDLTTICSETQ